MSLMRDKLTFVNFTIKTFIMVLIKKDIYLQQNFKIFKKLLIMLIILRFVKVLIKATKFKAFKLIIKNKFF